MDNKIVVDTIEKISIYTDDLSISQADIPYDASASNRPASQKDFFLASDLIVVQGDLVNPGREITLIARRVIMDGQLTIDTGGANPGTSFKAGELPQQTDTNFGAAGSNGQDASQGLASGKITVLAEHIELASGPSSGPTQILTIDGLARQSVAKATPAIVQSLGISSLALPGLSISMSFLGKNIKIKLSNATLIGLEHFTFGDIRVEKETGDLRLALIFPNLTINTGKIEYDGVELMGSTVSKTFQITSYTYFAQSSKGYLLKDTIVPFPAISFQDSLSNANVVYTPEKDDTVSQTFQQIISKQILDQINAVTALVPLRLYCQGGDGGRGQDGHDGIQGKKGADGVETSEHGTAMPNGTKIGTPDAAIGKPGTAGGKAGSAGHSKDAMGGGSIQLGVVKSFGPVSFLLSADGGIGGAKATPGKAGVGGKGGTGAAVKWDVIGDPGRIITGLAPDGKDGAQGAVPDFTGDNGKNGQGGKVLLNGNTLSTATVPFTGTDHTWLSSRIPLTILIIKQRATNLAYLNAQSANDYQQVAIGYQWLRQITAPFLNQQDPSGGKLSADDIAVRRQMNQSAQTELARMQQGLDYFGHTFNWVPVLSMAALKDRINDLLNIGKIIEDTFNDFNQQNASVADKLDQLGVMRKNLKTAIANDTNEITKLDQQISDNSTQLDATLNAINAQIDWIEQAKYDYKQQLEDYLLAQATKCTFSSFLKALFTIVKDTAEVLSGIGEIAEAAGGFSEAKDIFAGAKKVVTIIKSAEASVKSIQDIFNEISPKLTAAPDTAKILVDQQKFDDMVQENLGKFPAAKEFKDAVDHYFDLIKSHNRLALANTGLWVQKIRLKADIQQKNAELENVAAQASISNKSIPAGVISFMQNAYWNTKAILLRDLYQFNRAFEFWSLKSRSFLSSDLTIASLANTFVNWSNDIDTFLEQSGPFQPFTQEITIDSDLAPAGFTLLASTKKLNFRLNILDAESLGLANMTHIITTSVKIELPDLESSTKSAFLNLTHNGTSQLNAVKDLSAAGSIHTFTHATRTIPYKIDYANPADTAGGLIGDDKQGFPGLSPFTLWSLDFGSQGNEWIDLTKIKQVKLTFTGTFLEGN